jgi:hypothetical protein
MTYEDLLLVPYKRDGRDVNGMDCYGLVIECCRRVGKNLPDLVCENNAENLPAYIQSLGVVELFKPKRDCIAQFEHDGELHVGYMIDKKTIVHMTYKGVRVDPLSRLKNPRYFEVPE